MTDPRRLLANVFRRSGFTNVIAVPFASVPIVKFLDPETGIHGDINMNYQLGFFNTKLISAYCVEPRLKVLIRAVKTWAKSLGLNEPSPKGAGEQTSFSSYALTLMVIVFLQVKGILPNLQSELEAFDPFAPTGVFWLNKKGEENIACDIRFRTPEHWPRPSPVNGKEHVGDLLVEWFRFWGYEMSYEKSQASIRHGGFLPRAQREVQHSLHQSLHAISLSDRSGNTSQEQDLSAILESDASNELNDVTENGKNWRDLLVDLRKLDEVEYRQWRKNMDAAEQEEIRQTMKAAGLSVPKVVDWNDEPPTPTVSIDTGRKYQAIGIDGATEGIHENDIDEMAETAAAGGQMTGNNRRHGIFDRGLANPYVDEDTPEALADRWPSSAIVVIDPFIMAKNVAYGVKPAILKHFILECRRAVVMIDDLGAEFEDLLGDGKPIRAATGENLTKKRAQERPAVRGHGVLNVTKEFKERMQLRVQDDRVALGEASTERTNSVSSESRASARAQDRSSYVQESGWIVSSSLEALPVQRNPLPPLLPLGDLTRTQVQDQGWILYPPTRDI
ncbi:hypothetical protein SISSUDRAFT_571020 [Sistotremastrum suecicum HHB10207 ss-3]|uniref:polynucleotide adenylyltransferase n=1 Tax=Sistotremastrum suecicum HHB10207 ss-3 TaxID=1314776 RepID=A0A166ER44_9AGAM|nr:hypothetical protein SISSUDRAFT_571020 [Sistotremastrum suecicum HHB10207 ss-3]